MIVNGMTYAEITEEYKKIIQQARKQNYRNFDLNVARRYFAKNKHATNVYFGYRKIKIDANTNLYLIPFLTDKKTLEKNKRYSFSSFLVYFNAKGEQMVLIEGKTRKNGLSEYCFYTAHFFDRYRERFLKDPNIEKADVIYHFFKNSEQESRNIYHGKYKDYDHHFVGCTETGMTLGVFVEEEYALYTTFLTREDLNQKKTDEMNELDQIFKERENKFKKLKEMILSDPELHQAVKDHPMYTNIMMH